MPEFQIHSRITLPSFLLFYLPSSLGDYPFILSFIHLLKCVGIHSLPDTVLGDGYTEISQPAQPMGVRRLTRRGDAGSWGW